MNRAGSSLSPWSAPSCSSGACSTQPMLCQEASDLALAVSNGSYTLGVAKPMVILDGGPLFPPGTVFRKSRLMLAGDGGWSWFYLPTDGGL